MHSINYKVRRRKNVFTHILYPHKLVQYYSTNAITLVLNDVLEKYLM